MACQAFGQVELICHALADYGLTSAALAKQERAGRLPRDAADEILADMYDPQGQNQGRLTVLLIRVRMEADQATGRPNDYATDLMRRCVAARGNPDGFLGSGS